MVPGRRVLCVGFDSWGPWPCSEAGALLVSGLPWEPAAGEEPASIWGETTSLRGGEVRGLLGVQSETEKSIFLRRLAFIS